MNGSHFNHANDSGPIPLPSVMPPELLETSRLMDALGECDRASAPAGLEGRLLTSLKTSVLPAAPVQGAADVTDASQRMERLAQVDQAAASRTLEDRIFMATRGVLTAHAVKMNVQMMVGKRPARPMSFAMRAAAGLLLGGGVIWGYMALKPVNPISNSPDKAALAVKNLEKEIDEHMVQLGDIFALARIDTTESIGVSTDEASDTGDNWFQYDFLEGGDSI